MDLKLWSMDQDSSLLVSVSTFYWNTINIIHLCVYLATSTFHQQCREAIPLTRSFKVQSTYIWSFTAKPS